MSLSNQEIFRALFADDNTGSGDELILRLVPGKVHPALGDPTLNRALAREDCVTAGNLDFVLFIKAGGLCTSSETHLTYPPSLLSPDEPAQQIAPRSQMENTAAQGFSVLLQKSRPTLSDEPVDVTSSIYLELRALQQMWILMG